ncbi:alanine racemase [Synechococcus sp. A15-24]|uniref:alanine racemase n=1 Tax=Synechococcus sp. A15-24 TaxID=1050635 RepID=UPI0016484DEE|nr:alanine racemase [Synechococcus sp. A15-24]QNJ29984.1 alanine racemase [Synechococcus sp. A15-24]
MSELSPRQRAWVEVSPTAIEANCRLLCRRLAPGCQLMAVVKADGYGHGAVTVATAALRGGASSLGVATLQEGLELRDAGIEAPVLILSALPNSEDLRHCLERRLMPTLSSLDEANTAAAVAAWRGTERFPVQLKLDTGMARLGSEWQEGAQLVQSIRALPQLDLVGLYSHLACADEPEDQFTHVQLQRFGSVIEALPDGGRGLCCHLANSAGTLQDPRFHLDMVRVGLALYGQSPAEHLGQDLALQPALAVKARVSLIREVPSGSGVSYGHRFVTSRPSRLAVIAIGYADGVVRALSGRIDVLHRGRRLPQVGNITMDQIIVDATDVEDLTVGDSVTLLGEDGGDRISPQDWSTRCGSIPWEILCGFKHRLPRVEI